MERAIQLFHRRYSVPVVATLYASGGMRFGELLTRLGASRDTLSETLSNLVANDLVEREETAGGHEQYVLTAQGAALGEASIGAVATARETDIIRIALKKWPFLVLVAVGRGAQRYSTLRAALPGITPRSLTLALKDLQNEKLVERTIGAGYPPTTAYTLTERGASAFPPLNKLVSTAEAMVPGE
jgi:DNA-binding HxlR family transcriptional regulator